MSQTSSGATTEDLSVTSTPNREPMLAGFPWVSAIILYTLSWGWSLLRPNTLYWDWAVLFNKPANYGLQYLSDMGQAPWRGLVEFCLAQLGTWTFSIATFAMFFMTSLFIFEILRPAIFLSVSQVRLITILFLIVPVTHARIAIAVFSYTTSYFLFFLGWLILVRYQSFRSFILSWLFLFLSLMTHSLLFFLLLPFLQFVYVNRKDLANSNKFGPTYTRISLIAILPIFYSVLKVFIWKPSERWSDYHQIYPRGIALGLIYYLPFVLLSFLLIFKKSVKTKFPSLLIVNLGFFALGSAMFPYFAGNYFDRWSILEFNSDWSSRHQLLMPLGLALSVVGLNELFNWRKKNVVFVATIVLSVTLNMFWGSQYFLMSHKQEQLVELFGTTKNKIEIASVEDQAMQFNGRGSRFRSAEWIGFMTLAEISTDRPGCESLPSGAALTLKSNTPYLKALVTRDLDLYFEVKPCSEVLAENG
jgi:hypothetical protein